MSRRLPDVRGELTSGLGQTRVAEVVRGALRLLYEFIVGARRSIYR